MLKVVLDTSVFIAGLIKDSTCRDIINQLKNSRFILVISPSILEKLVDVISRPKFRGVITQDIAHKLLEIIKTQAQVVTPSARISLIKDDPEDNQFIEAAVEAKASIIVSVDKHLLDLKENSPVPVLTPAEFLKKLKKPNKIPLRKRPLRY